MNIDEQLRDGWKEYYRAVAAGDVVRAKAIFDRTVALAEAPHRRKTTVRLLAPVLARVTTSG